MAEIDKKSQRKYTQQEAICTKMHTNKYNEYNNKHEKKGIANYANPTSTLKTNKVIKTTNVSLQEPSSD